MTTEQVVSTPNAESAAPAQNAVPSLDSIAQKMAAMRNQAAATNATETGGTEKAETESPVVPDGLDPESVLPEDDNTETELSEGQEEGHAPEEVSTTDSTQQEIIDFIEFSEENPNAKFKFMRNGKEMVIDAKRAAAILGQGGAIHEEARELKVQKAEFDEYLKSKKAEAEGLTLALEFTVRPQLQKAYDEILKTQGYQNTFRQQYEAAQARNDYATMTRIQANMQQNERWIQQQNSTIQQLKPNVDQFYELRRQQVNEVLDTNRKSFQDKELKNEYVFNELREKVSKNWKGAKNQLVPGVDNIDLISSDEHILSLIRDGFKYREKPTTKSAGSSIAALTNKRAGIANSKSQGQANFEQLQQAAKGGDRKAQDNLLVAKLNAMRGRR
jgi:ribosomal protein L20